MPVRPSTGAGLIMVPVGAVIAWGGLTGYLPAILAALFAPSELTRRNTATIDLPPPLLLPPGEGGSGTPGPSTGGTPNAPLNPGEFNPPAIGEGIGEGEIVPPGALSPYSGIPLANPTPALPPAGGASESIGEKIVKGIEDGLKKGLEDIKP